VGTGINNLLQGKVKHALSDTGRVVVNSTLGVGGLFDIASRMRLEKHDEDFGQTLGKWGMKAGPYVVLPFLGPNTVRDGVGFIGDNFMDPISYVEDDGLRYGLTAGKLINKRSQIIEKIELLDQATLDPYLFQRDVYLQKREFEVRDGQKTDDF
jgi:phospholipid-binding lipoprotein MlaA